MAEHKNLAAALIAAQQEFKDINKDNTVRVTSQRTGKTHEYKYADLGSVLESTTTALHNNGLVISQCMDFAPNGAPCVKTILMHAHSDDTLVSMTEIVWADKSDPQKFGGGITYSRRYAQMAMLNLNAEDDDGQHARQPAQNRPQNAPQSRRSDVNPETGEILDTGRYDAVEEANGRSRSNNPPSDKQMGMMNALIKQKFGDDIDSARALMVSITGKNSRTQLDKSDASKFIDALMKEQDYVAEQDDDGF